MAGLHGPVAFWRPEEALFVRSTTVYFLMAMRTSLAQNVMQFPFHEIRAVTASS
jgi:hypothetical protein